ncbi:MAG: hypothetical protein HEQ13_14460 [Dolichospermum sp. DEX189]|uniref:Uncharacterized protein n=1 Tax=Aphanizomenon flos-aquae FACHB-1040 TaxID=2692887 RepID=A0ABR8BWC1_APHFL|nr:hypothetical protein [Aphanizomenon flos-aquae]MBD2278365.1 hypothetical protein [Aphanizomenon flos-aquae FACHB-1040]MBO1070495.1 hypothetical protein [Dolichospermum sp. DEX189]
MSKIDDLTRLKHIKDWAREALYGSTHWCQLNVKPLSRKELNSSHSQSLTGNEF